MGLHSLQKENTNLVDSIKIVYLSYIQQETKGKIYVFVFLILQVSDIALTFEQLVTRREFSSVLSGRRRDWN
jgi:hypothetical protein